MRSTSTHPAERETPASEAMREAVAREIAPRAWQAADELRDWPDSEYRRAHMMHCGPSLEAADRILSGPLATAVARARREALEEAAAKAKAVLDEATRMSAILLAAGEMTAGERRTSKAVADMLTRKVLRALAATPPKARQTEATP